MAKVKKLPYSGKSGSERDFVKLVDSLAHTRRHSEVMNDFLELAYCALAKTTHFAGSPQAEALEERYMAVVRRCKDDDYIRRMPELLALTKAGLDEHGDFLGRCAGELGGLNEYLGQFFSPFELCRMMARTILGDVTPLLEERGWIAVSEPAVGGGAMILAVAEYLEELGYDPATSMYVEAVDVSNTAFQMAYVQFSLRGVSAEVIRGNSLSLEVWERQFTTPMGAFLLEHSESWINWRSTSVLKPSVQISSDQPTLIDAAPVRSAPKSIERPPTKPSKPAATGQMALF